MRPCIASQATMPRVNKTEAAIPMTTRVFRKALACCWKVANSRVQGEHVAKWLHQELTFSPRSLPNAIAFIVSESAQPFLSGFGNWFRKSSLALLRNFSSCVVESSFWFSEEPFGSKLISFSTRISAYSSISSGPSALALQQVVSSLLQTAQEPLLSRTLAQAQVMPNLLP